MRILKNIFRRKMRAFLTIFGITIGVLALVVMGAMAEKLNLLVDGGLRYYGDKVVISEKSTAGNMFASQPLSLRKIQEIERVDGVARCSASIMMLLDDEVGMSMGSPPMLSGEDGRAEGYEQFEVHYTEGRQLKPGDRGKVVVGSDLVTKLNAQLGGTVTIRDEKFEVVGVLAKTLTAPDTSVAMSLEDAQDLYYDSLPDAIQIGMNKRDIATSMAVYLEPGRDPDVMARLIQYKVEGISAQGPRAFREQVVDSMAMFNSIIFGIGAISLLVGGLSVINTMSMAVAERTREIGIRKAIGASSFAIMRQFIAESAVIGLLGGLFGLGLGWLIVQAGNSAGDTALFLITTRLALGSVSFALGLGIVSGLYPAWHAANLNPVVALRHE